MTTSKKARVKAVKMWAVKMRFYGLNKLLHAFSSAALARKWISNFAADKSSQAYFSIVPVTVTPAKRAQKESGRGKR